MKRASSGITAKRVDRDKRNAAQVQADARAVLGRKQNSLNPMFMQMQQRSFEAIARTAFQVMVEVEVELANGETQDQLWYGNEGVSVNSPLNGVNVLAWTHLGLQAALTEDLGEYVELFGRGYKAAKTHKVMIVGLCSKARARFRRVTPEIVGLYEPGGVVGEEARPTPTRSVGLKAVRLDMTRDQSRAFRSAMSGMLMITGAPGSGKTTVAFQRIRFLIDQQDSGGESLGIRYDFQSTRIFLANRNLIQFSKAFLEQELDVPSSSIEQVGELIDQYIDATWEWKKDTQPRRRAMTALEHKSRDSMLGLCGEEELRACWNRYEKQIAERLSDARGAEWERWASIKGVPTESLLSALRQVSKGTAGKTPKPFQSPWRMDAVYQKVRPSYDATRGALVSASDRDKFDEYFAQWLYHVYDPLDALWSYFGQHQYAAEVRIRRGTNDRADPAKVLKQMLDDWSKRLYGEEEHAWIAFLLRFALPEAVDPEARFRAVAHGLASIGAPWNHIVIDEAQDLSAAEAVFLSSLTNRSGALTVSADFHQRVSAAHGMDDAEAIKLGLPFVNPESLSPFRFAENKRQSAEITRFLSSPWQKSSRV